ncbi:hypothetical protein ES703_09963 [subsurface metagenome]
MEGEAIEGASPLQESALILSGPDDSIFDDIFDWIQSAISTIVSTVTSWISMAWSAITTTVISWISWLWNSITSWFSFVFSRLIQVRDYVVSWITTQVGQVWSWITTSISNVITTVGAWFSQQWAQISSLFSAWWSSLSEWFTNLWNTISGWFTALYSQLESWFTWLGDFIREEVVTSMATWWSQLLDRLLDVGSWIGALLNGIADWFEQDIPGASPRWESILESIWGFGIITLAKAWQRIFDEGVGVIPTILIDNLAWLGELFTNVFETFMEALMGLVKQIGPTNPSIAVNSYAAMAKVGMVALGGLAGMTLAGSWLKPLGGAGLGQIAAMIYDMTNYKMITGVFIGALTFAMLRQPLTYYFNEIFRPFILRIGDFMELMARDAWSHPELLREPTLISSVQELTQGEGTAFEKQMIGYYGYPAQYYGLFKELSFAPLRYFPLAGIARVGFWDEPWFTEALSRSGYSPTAREALMGMYREMVLTTRQLPVMYQVKRLSREGFATMEEIKVHLEKAAAMETLTECRLFAMELEQEFSQKEMAFDIIMRAFSRGVILEEETRGGLSGLGIPEAMLDLHLMREKLGLLRRISIPTEAAAPVIFGVEE